MTSSSVDVVLVMFVTASLLATTWLAAAGPATVGFWAGRGRTWGRVGRLGLAWLLGCYVT